LNWKKKLEMGPPQLSPQCGDNRFIGKSPRELDYAVQTFLAKPPTELLLQLSPQRSDNLSAVFRSLLRQKADVDTGADLPSTVLLMRC
jgi:hypothetical protein